MHIFAYSKREGTVASKYGALSGDIVKSRTKLAERIARKNKADYYKSFIGKKVEILMENDGGYTREYVKVLTSGIEGELLQVVPTSYDEINEVLLV